MTDPPDIEPFAAQLRAYDPDRFLTARFAEEKSRPALITLYAFNSELANICNSVSEPALGEIRLQWWRDVLQAEDESVKTGAPLADALAHTVATYGLPRSLLLGMIDARSADIDGGGFADLPALKAYLYKSDGALFALSAHVLGSSSASIGKIANAAGLAYGITRLLRQLPGDSAAGRIMLPLSMLSETGILPEQLLAGEDTDGLTSLIKQLAKEARTMHAEALQKLAEIPLSSRGSFAPLALVESYLRAIERTGRLALHEVADINPLRRFLTLWWAVRFGKV